MPDTVNGGKSLLEKEKMAKRRESVQGWNGKNCRAPGDIPTDR